MNAKQAKRLLNVARALRESKAPQLFTMKKFVWGDGIGAFQLGDAHTVREQEVNFCGTPACALGHYGARRDLQKTFNIFRCKSPTDRGVLAYFSDEDTPLNARQIEAAGRPGIGCDAPSVLEHFGITNDEAHDLFSDSGCGSATTPIAAAKYIEQFVKSKRRVQK